MTTLKDSIAYQKLREQWDSEWNNKTLYDVAQRWTELELSNECTEDAVSEYLQEIARYIVDRAEKSNRLLRAVMPEKHGAIGHGRVKENPWELVIRRLEDLQQVRSGDIEAAHGIVFAREVYLQILDGHQPPPPVELFPLPPLPPPTLGAIDQKKSDLAQAATSNIKHQESGQSSSGYLTIEDAIKLLLGEPVDKSLNEIRYAKLLFQAALQAKNHRTWKVTVEVLKHKPPLSGETHYVDVGEFLEWAQLNPAGLPDDAEIWTPETLEAERIRKENARNRPDSSFEEQEKAKKRIQWAKALLRRFAAVGLSAEESVCQLDKLKQVDAPSDSKSSVVKAARKVKTQNTVERNRDIQRFVKKIYKKGKAAQLNWALVDGPIPYTRADFMSVFWDWRPAYTRRKPETMELVLKQLGIKFQRGTRNNNSLNLQRLISS